MPSHMFCIVLSFECLGESTLKLLLIVLQVV